MTARKQWATQQDSSNALTVILPSCTWPACTENAMRNVRICMHNNADQAITMTMTITAWCLLLGAALFALLLAMKGPVLGFVADCVSDQHHSSLRHQHVVNWANVEHIWELLHVPWCPRLMPGLVNQWLSIGDRVSMTKTLRQFPKSTQATDPRRSFKWSLCMTSASVSHQGYFLWAGATEGDITSLLWSGAILDTQQCRAKGQYQHQFWECDMVRLSRKFVVMSCFPMFYCTAQWHCTQRKKMPSTKGSNCSAMWCWTAMISSSAGQLHLLLQLIQPACGPNTLSQLHLPARPRPQWW